MIDESDEKATVDWVFDHVIYGEPGSAKNSRRIVKFGKRPALIKSEKALNYEKLFNAQCPRLSPLLEGDVSLRVDVWYKSRRPDLACVDLIQDLLEGKVYTNDRQVKASMSIWNLDKEEPRCRIRVKSISTESSLGLSSLKLSEIWGISEHS